MKIDEKTGKISLSHKETMEKPEGWEERPERPQRREGGNNGPRNNGNRQGGNGGNRGPRPNGDYKRPENKPAEVKAEPVPVAKKEEAPKQEEKGSGFFSKLLGK